MNIDKDIISIDSQGWPVYKKTLREILESLGARVENGIIGFDNDNFILDVYPTILEDDGMGYGVSPKYITEASSYSSNGNNSINIFVEPKNEDKKK